MPTTRSMGHCQLFGSCRARARLADSTRTAVDVRLKHGTAPAWAMIVARLWVSLIILDLSVDDKFPAPRRRCDKSHPRRASPQPAGTARPFAVAGSARWSATAVDSSKKTARPPKCDRYTSCSVPLRCLFAEDRGHPISQPRAREDVPLRMPAGAVAEQDTCPCRVH